jgi:acyl-coenzyme A thioesterase PaaI-like protein
VARDNQSRAPSSGKPIIPLYPYSPRCDAPPKESPGATSSIADSAGGYAAFTLFPDDTSVLTVEYKINLLAPAEGEYLEAVGEVIKSGRTLTICRLDVIGVTGAKRSLVAVGQQTLIQTDARPDR